MLIYVAVRCPDEATRDRLTYVRLILHLAQKHGGQGWLEYDHTLHAQAASDPTLWWNAINPSLMASSIMNVVNAGTYCHYCRDVDHRPQDCALLTTDPSLHSAVRARTCHAYTLPGPLCQRPFVRPSSYDSAVEVCRRFNRGLCLDAARCKFHHICSVSDCKTLIHGVYTCPLRNISATSKLPEYSSAAPK